MRHRGGEDLLRLLRVDPVLLHGAEAVNGAQCFVCRGRVAVVHGEVVHIIGVRGEAVEHEAAFRLAGTHALPHGILVRRLHLIAGESGGKDRRRQRLQRGILRADKQHGAILGHCLLLPLGGKEGGKARKEHGNGDERHKENRNAYEHLVFCVILQFKFQNGAKLFHVLPPYACSPAYSTKMSLSEGSNTLISSTS